MDLSMVPYKGSDIGRHGEERGEVEEKNGKQLCGGAARYWECMKNHAAGLGAQALDGCGEFMPGGDPGTLEALKCAACGCHRNFHRKDDCAAGAADFVPYDHPPHPLLLYAAADSPTSKFPSFFRHHHPLSLPPPPPPHMLPLPGGHAYRPVAFPPPPSGVVEGGRGSETPPPPPAPPLVPDMASAKDRSRKRFRTKFTPEQKEEMLKFAEKVGWRIQRHDNDELQEFCTKVGVKRHVLKVWMHNNKGSLSGAGRAPGPSNPDPSPAIPV
uniref:ZF-HD homeobox protein At4g24660 n=1 Tax=Anthurium amnicola TaxID=1678845 RepID=A0A1D1XIY1_9ARAE